MIRNIFFSVCFLLILSVFAYAQDNTIVVTATRNAAKIAQTPSKVNIITAKQLKDKGILYVQDALSDISGISVSSSGAFGGTTGIYTRGLSGYYTKILIDGVDVSDSSLTKPYYDLSNLMVSDINKIEIVQGAQSGLYGSNAIGSVINIITKNGEGKPYFKYSQEAGSFHTYKETVESGGSYKNLNFYLESSRFDTGGISKMDKLNPDSSYSRGDEDDSYHRTALSAQIEYNFDTESKIGTVIKLYKTRNYLDNSWPPNDASASNNTPSSKGLRSINDFLMSKEYMDKKMDRLKLKFDAFYVQNFRYYKSAPSFWLDYKGKRWGSDLLAVYKIKQTKITGGFTHKIEKYEDSSLFSKLRYNYAGFVELEHRISNLILQGVVRDDEYKTFGKHFTYKLGADYLIAQTGTTLKANYSTGFRAPSIYELYAPPNPSWGFLGGNHNLRPENAQTWDFGFVQNLAKNRVSFSALYFKNVVKDRIAYYMNSSTWQSTYKNVEGKTVSNGVELGVKAKPVKPITIGANYTYTKSKDPITGEQAARIPLRIYNGYIGLSVFNNRLTGTINGKYIGKRYDEAAQIHQTGKYAVFDCTMIYKPAENLEALLSIKNIFNRFYEEVYGYSTLPRSVFATVSYKF